MFTLKQQPTSQSWSFHGLVVNSFASCKTTVLLPYKSQKVSVTTVLQQIIEFVVSFHKWLLCFIYVEFFVHNMIFFTVFNLDIATKRYVVFFFKCVEKIVFFYFEVENTRNTKKSKNDVSIGSFSSFPLSHKINKNES